MNVNTRIDAYRNLKYILDEMKELYMKNDYAGKNSPMFCKVTNYILDIEEQVEILKNDEDFDTEVLEDNNDIDEND